MLEKKVAIITGGTRGIGFETAKLFAQNKAQVIIFGSKEETVLEALDKLKTLDLQVDGYYPNLNDFDAIEKTMKEIIQKYDKIDILINNAGISANKKIEDTSIKEIDQILDLNVKALLYVTKAVVPYMKKQKKL